MIAGLVLALLPALLTCGLAGTGRVHRRWALWPLLLLAVGWHAAAFDARPHLTEKLDATTLVWLGSVEVRAYTGAFAILVAAPLGWALDLPRRALGGALVIGVPGVGLAASSAFLFVGMRRAAESPPDLQMWMLLDTITLSQLPLWAGATIGAGAAGVLAWQSARPS